MIRFFKENISFRFKNKTAIQACIHNTFFAHNILKYNINYIFTNDENILRINRDFLNHDYYTDIITFNNSIDHNKLESDIFISIERVKENAIKLNSSFEEELNRVIFHGILHLCGYNDKSKKEKETIRQLENECLKSLKIIISNSTK